MSVDLWALDWAQIGSRGVLLHGPVLTPDERADSDKTYEGVIAAAGSTLCGKRGVYLHVPGVLSRMHADRCNRCCDKAGYPRGHGSPKNDPAIRALLNLDEGDNA